MPETRQFTVAEDSPSFWRVIFNNHPINLLDPDAIRELHRLIATVEATDALKLVVFESANPDYFIAHYDISRAGETPPWADVTMRLAHTSVVSIARHVVPHDSFRYPHFFHPLATANSILIRRDKPLQMTLLPGGPSLARAR